MYDILNSLVSHSDNTTYGTCLIIHLEWKCRYVEMRKTNKNMNIKIYI